MMSIEAVVAKEGLRRFGGLGWAPAFRSGWIKEGADANARGKVVDEDDDNDNDDDDKGCPEKCSGVGIAADTTCG